MLAVRDIQLSKLSAAGFVSWNHWGRGSTNPTSLPVEKFSNSFLGLVAGREVNATGDEVLADGTFNNNAVIGNSVQVRVVSPQTILADATTSAVPSAGNP